MEQFIIRHCPRSWRSTTNFKKQNPCLHRKRFIISISQHLIAPFKVHKTYSYIYTKRIYIGSNITSLLISGILSCLTLPINSSNARPQPLFIPLST